MEVACHTRTASAQAEIGEGAIPGSKLFITRRCPGVAAKNLTELANIKGSEIDKIALPLMLIRRKYLGLILNHWL